MVQGEAMKKRMELYGKGRLPVYWLFIAGFLAGVLLPNLMWRMEWQQKTAASVYLLSSFANGSVEGKEYFLYVLRRRGVPFLLAAFCGVSVFGAPLAVLGVLLAGFHVGLLLTMSILQFGFQGGLIGAGALFPQGLLYLPCLFWLMWLVYRQSMEIWRSRGLLVTGTSRYVLRVLCCAVLCLGGILLETWCNPAVMEVLVKTLKFY